MISNLNIKILNNTAKVKLQLQKQEQLTSRRNEINTNHYLQSKDNFKSTQEKTYTVNAETELKQIFNNHTKSLNLQPYQNDTELFKGYLTIERSNFTRKIT